MLPGIVDDLSTGPFSINIIDVSKEVHDNLADPSFAKARTIYLLIGGGSFYTQSELISAWTP